MRRLLAAVMAAGGVLCFIYTAEAVVVLRASARAKEAQMHYVFHVLIPYWLAGVAIGVTAMLVMFLGLSALEKRGPSR